MKTKFTWIIIALFISTFVIVPFAQGAGNETQKKLKSIVDAVTSGKAELAETRVLKVTIDLKWTETYESNDQRNQSWAKYAVSLNERGGGYANIFKMPLDWDAKNYFMIDGRLTTSAAGYSVTASDSSNGAYGITGIEQPPPNSAKIMGQGNTEKLPIAIGTSPFQLYASKRREPPYDKVFNIPADCTFEKDPFQIENISYNDLRNGEIVLPISANGGYTNDEYLPDYNGKYKRVTEKKRVSVSGTIRLEMKPSECDAFSNMKEGIDYKFVPETPQSECGSPSPAEFDPDTGVININQTIWETCGAEYRNAIFAHEAYHQREQYRKGRKMKNLTRQELLDLEYEAYAATADYILKCTSFGNIADQQEAEDLQWLVSLIYSDGRKLSKKETQDLLKKAMENKNCAGGGTVPREGPQRTRPGSNTGQPPRRGTPPPPGWEPPDYDETHGTSRSTQDTADNMFERAIKSFLK